MTLTHISLASIFLGGPGQTVQTQTLRQWSEMTQDEHESKRNDPGRNCVTIVVNR